jgi:hypothetical protein
MGRKHQFADRDRSGGSRPERDIRGVDQHSGKPTLPGPAQVQFRSPPGARYVLLIAEAHIDELIGRDMQPPPETT